MKNQNFGIEIELTGITREAAATVMANYFGTRASYLGAGYDTWIAKDQQGRTWKAMSDSSIRATLRDGTATSDARYRTEIVSPICVYENIETVQEIVRLLRGEGARVNESTGIHVHINAAPHTAQSLRVLANMFASREDLLVAALAINSSRTDRWCQKADKGFMTRLNDSKPATRDQLKAIWYNGRDESMDHYSHTRYRMLNFHAVFSKGTVEFRCFNGTTHAGEIKAYIQFCLAVSHQALTQRSATYKPVVTDNAKYTFRCWLLRLGLIGDEFKTARLHLMKHLEGNSAWRHAS